jgi:hypothetical protein
VLTTNKSSSSINKTKNSQTNSNNFEKKLEEKVSNIKSISKQRDSLRNQLASATKYLKELQDSQNYSSINPSETVPSLQTQLQLIQDQNKQSKAQGITLKNNYLNIIQALENNDKMLRAKFDTAMRKLSNYKQALMEKKMEIKILKSTGGGSSGDEGNIEERIREIRKIIRKEEKEKIKQEIERIEQLFRDKSEKQAEMQNQDIERFEAQVEAKDSEIVDLLAKQSELEGEILKLRDVINSSTSGKLPGFETGDSPGGRNSDFSVVMKNIKKVELVDEKIVELGSKIDSLKLDLTERIEKELDDINNSIFNNQSQSSTIINLGEKTFEKITKMKETNTVVQIVRKLNVEGFNWLLVERKRNDPLRNPLGNKSSSSLSKSDLKHQPVGRKLFWLCEDTLDEELHEYVYSYTPKFLVDNGSLELTIPDFFHNDTERKSWRLLNEMVDELKQKRRDLQKELREIKLGIRRENFLNEEPLTKENEVKIRELEHK